MLQIPDEAFAAAFMGGGVANTPESHSFQVDDEESAGNAGSSSSATVLDVSTTSLQSASSAHHAIDCVREAECRRALHHNLPEGGSSLWRDSRFGDSQEVGQTH